MSDTAVLALIVGLFGFLTAAIPVVLARQANRARAEEKRADNKRADELAARVAQVAANAERAAEKLATNTDKVAEATKEVSATLASATKRTDEKLDSQHVLINSLYSAAKKGELAAVELTLSTLHEMTDLRRSMGQTPTIKALATIEENEAKRTALIGEMEVRLRAQQQTTG